MSDSLRRASIAKAFVLDLVGRGVEKITDPAVEYHLALPLRPEGHPTIRTSDSARDNHTGVRPVADPASMQPEEGATPSCPTNLDNRSSNARITVDPSYVNEPAADLDELRQWLESRAAAHDRNTTEYARICARECRSLANETLVGGIIHDLATGRYATEPRPSDAPVEAPWRTKAREAIERLPDAEARRQILDAMAGNDVRVDKASAVASKQDIAVLHATANDLDRLSTGQLLLSMAPNVARALRETVARIESRTDYPKLIDARPLSEWHEDHGPVTWWLFPLAEPAWIGTPLDSDWPGYHTHWTPHPEAPGYHTEPPAERRSANPEAKR